MNTDFNIITSRQNQTVVDIYKLLDKKSRDVSRKFRFDGIKLFYEAVSAGVNIEIIVIKESQKDKITAETEKTYREKGIKYTGRTVVLSDFVFDKVTEEKGTQGIICVAEYIDILHKCIKIESNMLSEKFEKEKILLLSSVRDPGNVGTLIRSAAAFGIDNLIFSSDCADIYNPKTVRASMGALFRQKIYFSDSLEAVVSALKSSGRRVFAAEPNQKAASINSVGLMASDCIIIGNEGHGIAPEVTEACTGSVLIPISSSTESLNASIAAGICMWEMSKVHF